jgi:hypothetical protein
MSPETDEEGEAPSLAEVAQKAVREGNGWLLSKVQGNALDLIVEAVDEALATGCEPIWIRNLVLNTLAKRGHDFWSG